MENVEVQSGILTQLLTAFLDVFQLGYSNLLPDAHQLLGVLALLELTVAGIWWSLTQEEMLVPFLKKMMTIAFFLFLINEWPWFLDQLIQGFVQTGQKMGGFDKTPAFQNPSSILDMGFRLTAPINERLGALTTSWMQAITNIRDVIILGWALIFSWLGFFVLAAQVFITYLEFYMVAILSLILLPFGVFKHTSFLAEKVFAALISFGIKLMVLALILGIVVPVLDNLAMPLEVDQQSAFCLFAGVMVIAILAIHAPGIAAGLMTGNPSLSTGSIGRSGMAIGQTALAAAPLAGSTANMAARAPHFVAEKAGTLVQGGISGASQAKAAGGSSRAGAAGGLAKAGLGTVAQPFKNIGQGLADSYRLGARKGAQFVDKPKGSSGSKKM